MSGLGNTIFMNQTKGSWNHPKHPPNHEAHAALLRLSARVHRLELTTNALCEQAKRMGLEIGRAHFSGLRANPPTMPLRWIGLATRVVDALERKPK